MIKLFYEVIQEPEDELNDRLTCVVDLCSHSDQGNKILVTLVFTALPVGLKRSQHSPLQPADMDFDSGYIEDTPYLFWEFDRLTIYANDPGDAIRHLKWAAQLLPDLPNLHELFAARPDEDPLFVLLEHFDRLP